MTDPTNVHEPVPQSAKLTAREKKWIIYDVGNSAFVLLSTAVIPIYAKSLPQCQVMNSKNKKIARTVKNHSSEIRKVIEIG